MIDFQYKDCVITVESHAGYTVEHKMKEKLHKLLYEECEECLELRNDLDDAEDQYDDLLEENRALAKRLSELEEDKDD